jgi:mono/diheme cytochrome c family protein
MRRIALVSLGVLSFAPLFACAPNGARPEPGTTDTPPTSAPSVVATAPAAAEAPTTTSSAPPIVIPPTPAVPDPVVPVNAPPAATPGPMQARPISGGTLRILSDGRTAVASDADRDQVYVVDLVTGKVTATVALSPGDEPGRVVEDADGLAHVALRGGGAIATIDPKQGTLVARRALCPAPRGLAFEKDTNELHVACAGGELVSIAATPSVTTPLRTLSVDRDLRDVVVSTNGRLMVSTFRSAAVYVVDGSGVISSPKSVSRDSAGRNPGVAWRMVPRPDGSCFMLHELAQQATLGTFPGAYGGNKSPCSSIVTSTVTVVAPDASDATPPAMPFTGAVVAADVAVSPDGSQMAVVSIASAGTGNQVQFFNVVDGESTSNANLPIPPNLSNGCWPQAGPAMGDSSGSDDVAADGLAPPTTYLPPNGQVVAIAYDTRGNVIVQSREPASLQILTQRRDAITLSQDSRTDAGQQLFHSATSGQIACVSCHPEGGEDGRVWVFQGLGERRTQSLRGGIMDTAPFHWGGDESNMTTLMTDVFQGRMAGGAVDAQRVTALANWIDQIPTVPATRRADDATVARGTALFSSAGCVACHAGADFTNGQTLDVGTGGQFQVPQLHGLGLRAPYMHNGCAPTLLARFTTACGGDAKHLVGTTLSTAQVTDLIGYLETL